MVACGARDADTPGVTATKKRDAALGIVGGLVVNMSGSGLELDGAVRGCWMVVGFGLFAVGVMSLAESRG